jgi:hypothetical protein
VTALLERTPLEWLRRHAIWCSSPAFSGALALRLDGITKPFVQSRELHHALITRQYYLGRASGRPEWKQRVLRELGEVVQSIEPPAVDLLAATGYRMSGGEHLWIPRFIVPATQLP